MKKKLLWTAVLLLFTGFVTWFIWSNVSLALSHYSVESSEIPAAFDGFRMALVADLHNTEVGENNSKLLARVAESQPDIIVIAGDIIDSRTPNVDVALDFVNAAVEIAPVYYVTGNHEGRIPSEYAILEQGMTEAGVHILRNGTIFLERNGESICLAGIDAPHFYDNISDFFQTMPTLCSQEEYTVLLAHHPEYFDWYAEAGADLVLSGHVHGGQFRLPFIGGLVAPHKGFFPEYDSGLYENGGSNLVVSRGVGDTILPVRFNNRHEVVLVELRSIN